MTQEFFDKFWKGSGVRCEYDHSISGKVIELLSDGYIVIETVNGKFAFPPEQLEWTY